MSPLKIYNIIDKYFKDQTEHKIHTDVVYIVNDDLYSRRKDPALLLICENDYNYFLTCNVLSSDIYKTQRLFSYVYMSFTPTEYECKISIAKGHKTVDEQVDEKMVVSQLSKNIFKDKIYQPAP